jgi:hypothetical protein
MPSQSSRKTRAFREARIGNRRVGRSVWTTFLVVIVTAANAWPARGDLMNSGSSVVLPSQPVSQSVFPTVHPQHRHVRQLLENAMRYVAPESGTVDPVSGYIVEGWNDDPGQGLGLRSFTQLTAIGQWIELLSNVIAGHAETPHLSREDAARRLAHAVVTLRRDQADSRLSDRGLLGNFLDLSGGKRRGPLVSEVDKRRFVAAFGQPKGERIWEAVASKGWIVPTVTGQEAGVCRGRNYGSAFFDGPLAPYADAQTKSRIMALLDSRTVTVVFGDNANLTMSVGRAIGTLLQPEIKDRPAVVAVRENLEQFLETQREGYSFLYDPQAGLFRFGWDAGRGRFLGWEDAQGQWQTGYMDYMVNEFRGPTAFVTLRYDLPAAAVKNLGFKLKPYRMLGGQDVYVPAPWEGSAFQSLGLALSMSELGVPSWRRVLDSVVDIEIDYARRNQLPGFLSESYVGQGARYTGEVGIPEIAVTTMPRITHVASLYTLGVAYTIAPQKIEQFLACNWPIVSQLLTDHGPWEGFDTLKRAPVRIQTSAHTLSLILGLLGTGSQQMLRYLESTGLTSRLAEIYRPGEPLDFLSGQADVFAWAEKGAALESTRQQGSLQLKGDRVKQIGIALVPRDPRGADLSGGVLRIGYRSDQAIDRAVIDLKPVGTGAAAVPKIPNQLFARFRATRDLDEELLVVLPATLGLSGIKEVVVTWEPAKQDRTEFALTRFTFSPAILSE